jgi:hypothetical protein
MICCGFFWGDSSISTLLIHRLCEAQALVLKQTHSQNIPNLIKPGYSFADAAGNSENVITACQKD